MFGSPRHSGSDALAGQSLLQALAQGHHVTFAFGALFIQQPGNVLVGDRLQKAEGQVFHLPFNLPDAQAVGQGRKHLQGFAGQLGGHGQFGGGKVAQGLQARGQAQHDHPKVTAERQQHLAHVFCLQAGAERCVVSPPGVGLGRPGQALHHHQLVGLHGQLRQLRAKGLGHHLFGLVQVRAGIHQVTGRLHGHRTTNAGQDRGHSLGMRQDVFARVQRFARDQRLGKGAGFGQGFAVLGTFGGIGRGQHDGRKIRGMQTAGGRHRPGRMAGSGAAHGLNRPASAWPAPQFGHRLSRWGHDQNLAKCPTGRGGHARSWRWRFRG